MPHAQPEVQPGGMGFDKSILCACWGVFQAASAPLKGTGKGSAQTGMARGEGRLCQGGLSWCNLRMTRMEQVTQTASGHHSCHQQSSAAGQGT